MDRQTALQLLTRVRTARQKQADLPSALGPQDPQAFAGAVQALHSSDLRSDALGNVASLGALGLGVGAAGRGLVGLINALRQKKKRVRSGPAVLPLPFPVTTKASSWWGDLTSGRLSASKSGIPWYGPAMMTAGMAGLAGGWKGVDSVLESRRQSDRQAELEAARHEFHDALISQYDAPIATHPDLVKKRQKAASVSPTAEAAAVLDRAYDALTAAYAQAGEKRALNLNDLGGKALGGYGMYAGLTGLLAGMLTYDQASKRSQRAVIEKAIQRRQRRQFMQSPTEIYAVPEPVQTIPKIPRHEEARLLQEPPAPGEE